MNMPHGPSIRPQVLLPRQLRSDFDELRVDRPAIRISVPQRTELLAEEVRRSIEHFVPHGANLAPFQAHTALRSQKRASSMMNRIKLQKFLEFLAYQLISLLRAGKVGWQCLAGM